MKDHLVRKSVVLTKEQDVQIETLRQEKGVTYADMVRQLVDIAMAALKDREKEKIEGKREVGLAGELAAWLKVVAQQMGMSAEVVLARIVEDGMTEWAQAAQKRQKKREEARKLVNGLQRPEKEKTSDKEEEEEEEEEEGQELDSYTDPQLAERYRDEEALVAAR